MPADTPSGPGKPFRPYPPGRDRTRGNDEDSAWQRHLGVLLIDQDRLNLRFDERKLTSVTGTLGARIEFKQRYTFGALMPRVRAEWNHEFADTDAQRLDYADIPGSALYGIETHGWSREQSQLSAGTRFVLPSLWTFDLETGFRGASGQRSGSIRA